VVVLAYFAVLALLALWGLERALLALHALRRTSPIPPCREHPAVLVQLPLFNERTVVERLLRATAALRWPRDRLHVQVLDDSTDDTRLLVDREVAALRADGLRIDVLRRGRRTGFKAGALAEGLLASTEEPFVAIFDADFLPPSDFLERTMGAFEGPKVGLVQARWTHLNREEGWLTRAQAVFLDGHFGVEHAGRQARGAPFNFNGTAGVWRRQAIEAAGGWSSDTITEDLDLSFRAQMAGARFVYAHEVETPAELPNTMSAFRTQQARWVRGSAQTARKLLPRIWTQPGLGLRFRWAATLHLATNFTYVLMAALAILLPMAVVVRDQMGWRVVGGQALLSSFDLVSLGAGTLAMLIFYAIGLRRCQVPGGGRRWVDVPWALCLGAGLSWSNGRQVLRGLANEGQCFVRTPKRGGERSGGYRAPVASHGWELALTAYHLVAVAYGLINGLWGALPFLLMYAVGFGAIAGSSLREAYAEAREEAPRPQPKAA
jgi:cellulose synthase/poly-beta-1,6-N-acetylglucosamine synthase-like glycosyltransferase